MRKLFILFLMLFSVCASVFAAAPVTVYYFPKGNGSYDTTAYSSLGDACSAWAASPYGPSYAYTNRTGWHCTGTVAPANMTAQGTCISGAANCTVGAIATYNGVASYKSICSDGSAPDTTKALSLQCPDPVPVKKCNDAAGTTVSWWQYRGHAASASAKVEDAGTAGNYPLTSPTCGLTAVPDVVDCYTVPSSSGSGIDFYCKFTGVSNGGDSPDSAASAASTNVPANATQPANTSLSASETNGSCPGGTVQAGADSSGIPICIGNGTNPTKASSTSSTTTPTTTTTNSDGSTTTTSTKSTTNSDGSVTTTTTTTTTGTDGTVKTSVTSNTSSTPSGASGQNDDTKDFCSAHPELTVCQNSTVSGSCASVSCTGDAIQCATLRAAATMQCAQQQDIDALKAMSQKALGDQIMAGNDPMATQISDTLKGTDVDMSHVSFDQSGFLSGGTCLANRSFSVMGQSVAVDFTSLCNNIAPLRAVMMAVALILAYLIVGRSVVGS